MKQAYVEEHKNEHKTGSRIGFKHRFVMILLGYLLKKYPVTDRN